MTLEMTEIKLILLGESGVGKTSIIKRYLYSEFNENERSSIAMNYVEKEIVIKKEKVKLNIWDTIGQEKYRSLSKLFLSETKIIVLVYSIDNLDSFENLEYWYNLYTEQLGKDIVLGVAGNKSDLFLKEKVHEEQGIEFAKKHGGIFSLLSAKDNKEGIDIFFKNLVDKYLEKSNQEQQVINKRRSTIKLGESRGLSNQNKSGGCCGGGGSSGEKSRNKKLNSIKKSGGYLFAAFLGSSGVGKTSIIKRIKNLDFNDCEKHTINHKQTDIAFKNENLKINIIAFDTDNEKKEDGKTTVDIIKKSKIFFLIFDMNSRESFKEIISWIELIKKYKEYKDNEQNEVSFIIIANKIDLIDSSEIQNIKKSEIDSGNVQRKENEIGEKKKENLDEDKKKEGVLEEIVQENEVEKNEDKVSYDEANDLAAKYNGVFMVTSALTEEGISNVISDAIENYLNL